jgi:hypothetical protein
MPSDATKRTIGQWLGDTLFDAGRRVVQKLQAFQRTRTPAEQQAELEEWHRNHIPLRLSMNSQCSICGQPRARDSEHCPGPAKPWKAPNAATRRCMHRGAGLPGCAVCDPRFNGGFKYE